MCVYVPAPVTPAVPVALAATIPVTQACCVNMVGILHMR